MANQMKDAQLRALLKTVEAEIGAALKSEAGRLAKAAPGEEPDGDEGSAPSAPPDGDGDEGSAPAASPPPAAEGSAADPGASSASPGEAPADAGGGEAPGGDPAADGGGDMEALKGEYMKLGQEDPEALKAHYLACVEALQAVMGGGADGGGAPGGEAPPAPGGAPAPEAPPAPAAGPPAMKGELSAVAPKGQIGNGKDRLAAVQVAKKAELPGPPNGEDPTKKNEALTAEVEQLRKNQEQLVNAFDKFLGSPLRKAVTGVHSVGGDGKETNKTFTRETAKAALSAKIQTGTLKKSDRERAIAFTVGNLQIEDIKDLLA